MSEPEDGENGEAQGDLGRAVQVLRRWTLAALVATVVLVLATVSVVVLALRRCPAP